MWEVSRIHLPSLLAPSEPHMLAGKGNLEVVGDAVLDADIVGKLLADPGFVRPDPKQQDQ